MNNTVLSLLQESIQSDTKRNHLEEIFDLYEELKDTFDRELLYVKLRHWLSDKYKINSTKITQIDHERDIVDVIFHDGREFNSNSLYSFSYPFVIHPYLHGEFMFQADNKDHYNALVQEQEYFQTLFYELSPVIQNVFLHAELKEASFKDDVTGLYNRRFLMEHLKKMLPLAMRENKKIGFLMIGIDHFKAVVDEFDYIIGDRVLIELSKTITGNIRESDVVVRLDADEFLVVLANINSSDNAVMVANKFINDFKEKEVDVNAYTNQTLKKTICVGISMYPDDSTSIDQILKNADISLYEARNKGRSQVLLFENEQTSSIDLF